MRVGAYNIRGFHHLLKQNGVRELIKPHDVDIFGVLECKLDDGKLERIMKNKFRVKIIQQF